jgi:hypothetical protein
LHPCMSLTRLVWMVGGAMECNMFFIFFSSISAPFGLKTRVPALVREKHTIHPHTSDHTPSKTHISTC